MRYEATRFFVTPVETLTRSKAFGVAMPRCGFVTFITRSVDVWPDDGGRVRISVGFGTSTGIITSFTNCEFAAPFNSEGFFGGPRRAVFLAFFGDAFIAAIGFDADVFFAEVFFFFFAIRKDTECLTL